MGIAHSWDVDRDAELEITSPRGAVADGVPGWLGARSVGRAMVKPAWLFPWHLVVVGRSVSRNATRKAVETAGEC